MLIAQASDLHLHADPDHPNRARFIRVLEHLMTFDPVPDRLVLSGDLSDDGSVQSYVNLKETLALWQRPVHLALGNHDNRENFLHVFGAQHAEMGFVQGRTDLDGLQLFILDTNGPGRHGGAFCRSRAQWLEQELGRVGNAPALVFMHHPPCNIGVPWVDPGVHQEWTHLLQTASGNANVIAFCAGHVHMSGTFHWAGRAVLTCPSPASDMSLTFTDMHPQQPDGRPLVEQGEPAFALHRWNEGSLATFFVRCPQRVLAKWGDSNRAVIAEMMQEASLTPNY